MWLNVAGYEWYVSKRNKKVCVLIIRLSIIYYLSQVPLDLNSEFSPLELQAFLITFP